ncbi:MAG: gliding motility-associated protein GldE [Bacteroidetes bacterium]|nr:gliding motility-associated protein GldE [Bacteroidota bacterium]
MPGNLLLVVSANLPFLVISGLLLVFLLLLSAIVSGSEVAFFSLTHNDIDQCKSANTPKDRRIIHLLKKPQQLLATILILNNFINIAIVTFSTFLTWRISGSPDTGGGIVLTLSVLITASILIFGELLPKIFASTNNLGFAKFTSPFLKISNTILKPVSWLLLSISNVIEKRMSKKSYNVSVDELHHALKLTTKDEAHDNQKDILKGIVNFGTLNVTQVMKSRIDITSFESGINFHELMDQVNKSGFSRIPVFTETIDKIEGILYIKDMLPFIEEDENFKWRELLRPCLYIPESKKIDSLFKDFQEKRVHMAIVVDEYGGTSGLITLEDVIEEIIGEINDEFDDDVDREYKKIDDRTYIFEGKISLNDFGKIMGIDIGVFESVKGESESLGGLLLELNAKLPNAGEVISFDRFDFTIVSVDPRRIKDVRVHINNEE